MSKRLLVLACLASLILLAFAVRTYDLDGKSIWSDESLSLYRARESVPFILSGQIVIQDVPTQDTQPPLYFLLLHGLMAVAGAGTFVARYLSALASLLIIPLLYVLGRRLLDSTAGLFTALIGALSPLYLWYAQEIRMYTLLVALSAASVYALIRAVGNGKPERRWVLAYFAITAAMIYTHYSAFFLLGFQGLYLIIQAVRRRRWWLLAPMAVAGLVTLPVLPFVVRRLGLGPERDFHFVPLWIMLRDLWNAFSLGLSVDFYRVYPLDVAFLALLVAGLLALLPLDMPGLDTPSPTRPDGTRDGDRRQDVALFLLGYLFVPILALYAASYLKPMYQGARHLMIVSPAYYLLLGAGTSAMLSPRRLAPRRRARLALVATAAVILVGVGLSTRNYFTDPRYLKDDLRGLARYFQTHRGPHDVLVLSDGVLTLAFQYYLGDDVPIDAVPRFGTHLHADFPNHIQTLMDRYDRLWFMSPHPPVRAWLDRNLFQSDEVYFEGMNIPVMAAVYESEDPRLVEAPAGLRGQTTEMAGQLAFYGYAVLHNPARAGEVFAANLYWKPESRLKSDYHIAVTLTDNAGNVWGQGDAAPFGGLHPTSTWEPGTVLRQRHELKVNPGTPPGVYHLKLRVYDPMSGDALSGSVGDPSIDLGDIAVVRPDKPLSPRDVKPQVARDVGFGRRLRLLGFDLATRVRRPGDEIPLATYWQALGDLNSDYRLWLRLIGADGRLLAEKTVSPTAAGYPTSRWRVGDVLQGQHRLIVPADAAPGKATVVLSVVDPDGRPLTAHRLRWLPIGGTDVRLATIEIAPREHIVTQAPPMQHVLNADLAGAASLLGYDLDAGSIMPGQTFGIKLYWQARAVLDGNFKVTVQVLSSDNQVIAQHDSVPANWSRPTAGWLPGEVIADPHTLTLKPDTPPGTYRLIAAMYDPVNNSRLPATQDGEQRDYVVLDTLTIR
jgi:hypothetical protein